jgi:4-alpha-glucanotransferase
MTVALPELIRFGREICGDLTQAERREWWLANGLGGYAAGTIAGSLTRRYHGLLVAPVNPPLGRFLVLAKADATLVDGERRYPLFTNRWAGGAVEPAGHVHIESFRLEGRMPVWRYAIGDLALESRIWMEHGANTVYVAWRLLPGRASPRPVRLEVTLLANARDHHVSARPWEFHPVIEGAGPEVTVRHPNWFTLHVRACGGTLAPRHEWHENFQLTVEGERGLPEQDNHLCFARAELHLDEGEWSGLVAGLDADASPYLAESLRRALARDSGELRRAQVQNPDLVNAPPWMNQLLLAADSFIFARPVPAVPDGESVIAGYPWFGDWGRDTMIALPGLALATGRYQTALRILRTFARFVDRGMLPNVFPGAGETPEYNTADASLWYVEACRAYVAALRDRAALKELYPVLEDIVAWHIRGTRYGIRLDPQDGLLFAGESGVQVTWMDAKIGDWVVTPRAGKPVEINALWYNALAAMADFAEQLGHPSAPYGGLAERARAGFQRFLRPGDEGLYDVLDGPGGDDATLRPNQILAVSLPHSPLDREAQRRVVARVGRDLLTSYGLRSLDPAHPEFRACYLGGVWERDSSYHQGPVWAWLLGHYALAEARVTGDPQAAQERLAPLRDHLLDAGLGTVSEIFDGAAPHAPRGAPSQAWSVACALEAWWRLEQMKRQAETVGRISAA